MAKFDIVAVFKVTGLADLNKSFQQVGKSARNVTNNLKSMGNDATRLAGNITKFGVATAAALGGAAARFGQFESQFSDVVTLLDETSFGGAEELAGGIESLEQGVIGLRKETGETFENLNKGLFDLISAGRPAAQAIDELRTANELAIAGATETSVAVDGITSALGAYGEEAGDATDVSEKFFAAQKAGKTTIEELAGSVGLVAAQANSAGVSFDELLATVSAATFAGIRTKAAFTGLRGAIDNIQKPTARAEAEAERLGIQFDASALRSKGFVGLLKDVTASANFTQDSFVELFGSVEARNFALALANDEFERTGNILASVSDETQRAVIFNAALAEKQGTLAFQYQKFIGILDSVVTSIGRNLSPAFASLFSVIGDLLTEFQPEIEAFFSSVGDFLLGLAERLRANLPAIIEQIRGFFTSIGEAVTEIKEVFANLGDGNLFQAIIRSVEILAEKFAISEGVIYLVIAAIAQMIGVLPLAVSSIRLLASASFLLVNVFNLFSTAVTKVIIPLVVRLGTLFLGLFTSSTTASGGITLLTLSTNLLSFAIKALRIAMIALPLVGAAIAIGVLIDKTIGWQKVFEVLGDIAIKVFGWIVDWLADVGKGILGVIEFFAQLVAAIVYLFDPELGVKMSEGIRQAFEDLTQWIEDAFTAVVDFIKGIFSGVGDFFASLFGKAKEEVDDVHDQLKEIEKQQKKLQQQAEQGNIISGSSNRSTAISRAYGGPVFGPGSSTSDSVLAKLSRGEYVIRAASVRKFGKGFFDAVNNGVLPAIQGLASGGLVGALDGMAANITLNPQMNLEPAVANGSQTLGRVLNLVLPSGEIIKTRTDEETALKLQRNLRKSNMARSGSLPGWY